MLSKMNSFIDKKDFVSQVKVKCDNRPDEFYRKKWRNIGHLSDKQRDGQCYLKWIAPITKRILWVTLRWNVITDQMSSTGSTEMPINLRKVGQILLFSHAQRTGNVEFSLVVELTEFQPMKTDNVAYHSSYVPYFKSRVILSPVSLLRWKDTLEITTLRW